MALQPHDLLFFLLFVKLFLALGPVQMFSLPGILFKLVYVTLGFVRYMYMSMRVYISSLMRGKIVVHVEMERIVLVWQNLFLSIMDLLPDRQSQELGLSPPLLSLFAAISHKRSTFGAVR